MDGVTPEPLVIADLFERGSGVPAALGRLGTDVRIEPLPAGDYRIEGGIGIERKTVADLHGSLGRSRLWAQIGRLRDTAPFPYLLVEGDDLDAGPRHPNAIRGALLAVVDLGVALVRSRDPADSALWIHRLALRQQRRSSPRLRPVHGAPMTDPAVAVLSAVPGISGVTARALLHRFGSVEKLLAAGPKRWAEVDGIGTIRAHALATALLER